MIVLTWRVENIFWRVSKTMVSKGLICPLRVHVRPCTKSYHYGFDFIFGLFQVWSCRLEGHIWDRFTLNVL